jgi:cytochrome P450
MCILETAERDRVPLRRWRTVNRGGCPKCEIPQLAINEALRLCNSVPSGAQAANPPQGIDVTGFHIPGNVNVPVSQLELMTDERYLPSVTKFMPAR